MVYRHKLMADAPVMPNVSCLHTTVASRSDQKLSHTVPHTPSRHSSTLPWNSLAPSTRRTSPFTHERPGTGDGEMEGRKGGYNTNMATIQQLRWLRIEFSLDWLLNNVRSNQPSSSLKSGGF